MVSENFEKIDRIVALHIYNCGETVFLLPEALDIAYNQPSPITKACNGDFEDVVAWYRGYRCNARDKKNDVCFYRQAE